MGQPDRNQKPERQNADQLARQLQQMLDEQWTVGGPVPADPPEKSPEAPRPEPEIRPEDTGADPAPVRTGRRRKRRGCPVAVSVLHDFAYILAVVGLVFTFFVRLSWVEGASMQPTLTDRDQMLLLSSVWYPTPRRGDIVVARIPGFSRDPIVKRVIALEGDQVDIDFGKGIVYVNGEALEEPYILEPTRRDFGGEGISFPVTIREGHVFLMGDNRNDSYDSRYGSIGQVDQRCILGKAVLLAFPGKNPDSGRRDFSRVGIIDGG